MGEAMKTDGRILLAAAVIGVAAAGQAWATCAIDSFVSDYSVTQNGPTWTYVYSVQNGCATNRQPLLTDFYVPYFTDAGIANITVPMPDNSAQPPITWTYSINASDDLFGLGPDAGVLDFRVTSLTDVSPIQMLVGVGYYESSDFSFTSSYAPVKGPYAMLQTAYDGGLYDSSTMLFGDPSIPGSPDTIAALSGTAPESGTMALLALGLCAMAPALKRRGPRPTPLGLQYRAIYRVLAAKLVFQVASVTAHDYRRR